MTFKDFLKLTEQGTVGGPLGGPKASGALGMNLVALPKPQIGPTQLIVKKNLNKKNSINK